MNELSIIALPDTSIQTFKYNFRHSDLLPYLDSVRCDKCMHLLT